MNPNNISEFKNLSEFQSNGSDLIFKSTKMNLQKNSYEFSIHKVSKNKMINFKESKNWNFSNPKFSKNDKLISFVKTPKSSEILDSLEKKKNSLKNYLIIKNGNSEKVIFDTEDSIVNYVWSENNEFVYVITKEWSDQFKKIENKADEPTVINKLPFRFDTTGVIYNKRFHIYKVKISSLKIEKIVDGDKESLLSISSLIEVGSDLYFIGSQHNHDGTMLEEHIIKLSKSKLIKISSGGMFNQIFSLQDKLYAVGLRKRFDWPTNTTISKVSENGELIFLEHSFDRNVVSVKTHNNEIFCLYEDSGKTLLRNVSQKKTIIEEDITIKDFNFIGDDLYVIANSFSRPDEIFKLVNEKLERLSNINDDFNNKVKTFDCAYRRINTGQSEIDTWGIFVGKNKPTLLNIHGGPASQYGYTFFDEFQTYASAGFNVIACNPRGSTGRGHDFLRDVCGRKWGVNDVHDVLTSFKKMIKIMGIENKNYGIMGGSYGGFMTSWVIGHYPKMFKSAVVERALLNWETMVGTSDIGIGFPEMYLLDDMNNNLNLYRKKSPITYANNIITPTLIIHSEKDYRCPVEQAEQLFSNLKRRSIDTTMIRFPDESHELSRSGKPNHRIQRFEWIINWHKKQLK